MSLVLPVIDQIVRRNKDGSVFEVKWMDEVLVLYIQIWDPPILSSTWEVELSHGDTERLCLLYSAVSGSVGMEPWRLDWTARAWIIGEELSGTLVSWVNNADTYVMIAFV